MALIEDAPAVVAGIVLAGIAGVYGFGDPLVASARVTSRVISASTRASAFTMSPGKSIILRHGSARSTAGGSAQKKRQGQRDGVRRVVDRFRPDGGLISALAFASSLIPA
jgi:hypothetical protein